MARPNIQEQRREQILDAYAECVARYGVEGATLQRVADESGLARPLIHHNVGNRDDLLTALVERLDARGNAELAELFEYLPATGRCQAMLDMLFDARYASSHPDMQLQLALQFAAHERPELRPTLVRWHDAFLEALSTELAAEHAAANADAIYAVATGLEALYVNADVMSPLDPGGRIFSSSRQAAQRLMETL